MIPTVRVKPRITFSALADFMGASFTRRFTILKEQKYPSGGPIKNYNNALNQIRGYAVAGKPLRPSSEKLRPHEMEVLSLLQEQKWKCPTPSATFTNSHQKTFALGKVEISIFPDLLLFDTIRGKRATGALKMFFPKSRVLSPDAAKSMAALLYFYRQEVQNDILAKAELCIVYDCRRGKAFTASGNHKKLLKNTEDACRMIEMVWDQL